MTLQGKCLTACTAAPEPRLDRASWPLRLTRDRFVHCLPRRERVLLMCFDGFCTLSPDRGIGLDPWVKSFSVGEVTFESGKG